MHRLQGLSELGCPALEWVTPARTEAAAKTKKKGEAFINPYLCARV